MGLEGLLQIWTSPVSWRPWFSEGKGGRNPLGLRALMEGEQGDV